jgi:hypothetical protein
MIASPFPRLSLRALVSLLPVLAWAGGASDTTRTDCAPRIAEKLGVRFVQVCGAGENDASFWISVAPMPCSTGEHETIDCPSITPLLIGGTAAASPVPLTSRRVVVVDSFSAHRLCALRFAGRVATRVELESARAVLGLTALVVAEQSTPATEFRFEALPEWTADGECDNPSVPGERCRFARWPHAQARHAPMAEIRACDARAVGPSDRARTNTEIGGRCPAQGWSWDGLSAGASHDLPCDVHLAGITTRVSGAEDFALTCRAPDLQPPRAPATDLGSIAAFRCVVPTWALATFDQPTAPSGAPQ